jgi:dipeptidyl-peptidase 4
MLLQVLKMPELLTPKRLFSDPALTGNAPMDLKFSPDGTFLTYRRAAADNRERMDLWKVDIASAKHSEWINPTELGAQGADVTALTEAERAERERRRQFTFGITQYLWHPDGHHLLLPMDGQALLLDSRKRHLSPRLLTPTDTRQSGIQISPKGTWISYVRAGNVYLCQVEGGREQQLTNDASATLTNGLPDFLAAEEMHRFEGHWWSPDEQWLAYCKVDESPVKVSHRLEMDAEGARTIEQRYPYAGAANARVELWLHHLTSGDSAMIWHDVPENLARTDTTGAELNMNAYLARVHLDNQRVLIQTQDRRQHCLEIRSYALHTGEWRTLHTETSDTWINLTDNLQRLDDQRLLITSESSGMAQAKIINPDGDVITLQGPAHINAVLGCNDNTALVTGWQNSPLENHLYAVDLAGDGCHQITQEQGWHEVVVDLKHQLYIDRFSNERTPLCINVRALDGHGVNHKVYVEDISGDHPYTPYLQQHAYADFGTITAEDGQKLYYRLTPPADIRGKHPTIVYVYGGPGPQKARRDWGALLPQLFAQQGFAVLELDNRGTGNRGRAFEAPIYQQMGSVEVTDQVAGLSVLKDYSWADLSRVGVFGHSYGGYMTLMCLCQAAEHFKAGVAVAPVSDWLLYDTHYTERYMGLPQENPQGYSQANVLSHLTELRGHLLLMHGMADDNVLFAHSTMIMAKLQHLNKPFELMTYPGAKHSMQERDVSIHRFDMILDFFQRRLGQTR